MRVAVVDTETTGMDATDKVVEIAAVFMDPPGNRLNWTTMDSLINPGIPIPAVAKAVHHITEAMVSDAPTLEERVRFFKADCYIAHNAKFDRQFIGWLGPRWACTMKCAAVEWPDAPSMGNQALSYWLDLPRPPPHAGIAHRALYDVWTTAFIVEELFYRGWTVDQMIEVSSRPTLLNKFMFGKHEGKPLADIPSDYLQWMLKQDFDEDVMFSARHELDRRYQR